MVYTTSLAFYSEEWRLNLAIQILILNQNMIVKVGVRMKHLRDTDVKLAPLARFIRRNDNEMNECMKSGGSTSGDSKTRDIVFCYSRQIIYTQVVIVIV